MATIIGRKKGKSIELSGGNGQIIYKLPLVYLVYDDTGNQSEGTIISTAGLPLVNEPFTVDGIPFTIACKSKKAEQWENNNKYWTVTCDCDNEPFESSGGGGGDKENDPDDPTTWKPIWKIEYETIEVPAETDIYGTPVRNLAERPYGSAVLVKRLIPCIPFTQYEPYNQTFTNIMARHETLNSNTYFGGHKGTWMLTVEDCDKGFKNGVFCWRIDYKLRFLERYASEEAQSFWLVRDAAGTPVAITGGDNLVGPSIKNPSIQVVSGWQPLLPQIDVIDIDGNPVVDKKENQILGKIDSLGIRVPGQDQGSVNPYFLFTEVFPYFDFGSFLRINQED